MDETDNKILVDGNKIFFFTEVTRASVLELITKLSDIDNALQLESVKRGNIGIETPIKLYINSPGGLAIDGFLASDFIRYSVISPVHSIVSGQCASAATFISAVCKRRFMYPSSQFVVHEPANGFYGSYSDQKAQSKHIEEVYQMMIRFYVKFSNRTEKEIRSLISRDKYLTAEETLSIGFVDEIIS